MCAPPEFSIFLNKESVHSKCNQFWKNSYEAQLPTLLNGFPSLRTTKPKTNKMEEGRKGCLTNRKKYFLEI